MPERPATPLRPPGGARNRSPPPPNPNPPAEAPYLGCIAFHASADNVRCAFQTFVAEKKSAVLIDEIFVGVASGGAAKGATPSRARPTAKAIKRNSKWRMRDCEAGYDGSLPAHNVS